MTVTEWGKTRRAGDKRTSRAKSVAKLVQIVQQQKQQLQAEQEKSAANAAAIAANQAAIAADNKRFGELADYNILGEVTVLFANGEVTIEAQYKPQLLNLAQQAKGVTGYILQVQGYA